VALYSIDFAFALSCGENFLTDPASYDDLFYKLVESGDTLAKFRDAFALQGKEGSMQMLVSVSEHYQTLLRESRKKSKHLGPLEVGQVIKQGCETLSIDASERLDRWERFREQDYKGLVKRVGRVVVEDGKVVNYVE
jgi:hypothetical protein